MSNGADRKTLYQWCGGIVAQNGLEAKIFQERKSQPDKSDIFLSEGGNLYKGEAHER